MDFFRFNVLDICSRHTGSKTLLFLDQIAEEMPLPIQRIQTDPGRNFFTEKIQKRMMECGINFRGNKPASPYLNGKVKRSQRTEKEEVDPNVDLNLEALINSVSESQFYYNWQRTHGPLNGMKPAEKAIQLSDNTPFPEYVSNACVPENESIRIAIYQAGLKLRESKGCA